MSQGSRLQKVPYLFRRGKAPLVTGQPGQNGTAGQFRWNIRLCGELGLSPNSFRLIIWDLIGYRWTLLNPAMKLSE